MSLRVLNPNAEVLNKSAALHININAAKGLQDVLKTNLDPKGTIKMFDFRSIEANIVADNEIGKREKARLKEMQRMKKQNVQEILDKQNAIIDADM
ncbi:hypothetical protein Droror1_Dr00018158 [Drosera rotundifolia]